MFPIKELINLGFASIAIIAVSGGPWNFRENLRKAQIQMIREVGRTSNWGDPLVWHAESTKVRLRPRKAAQRSSLKSVAPPRPKAVNASEIFVQKKVRVAEQLGFYR